MSPKLPLILVSVSIAFLGLCLYFSIKHDIESEVFWGVLAIFNYITASQSYLVAELKEKE